RFLKARCGCNDGRERRGRRFSCRLMCLRSAWTPPTKWAPRSASLPTRAPWRAARRMILRRLLEFNLTVAAPEAQQGASRIGGARAKARGEALPTGQRLASDYSTVYSISSRAGDLK